MRKADFRLGRESLLPRHGVIGARNEAGGLERGQRSLHVARSHQDVEVHRVTQRVISVRKLAKNGPLERQRRHTCFVQ